MRLTELARKRSIWVLAAASLWWSAPCWAGLLDRDAGNSVEPVKTVYTCVMHHQIRRDKPGDCPICGMTLVPLQSLRPTPNGASPVPERKVKFWTDAMNPGSRSDKPGKAPDGMDLVPVYEEEKAEGGDPGVPAGLVPIRISPYKQQLIGVRLAEVVRAPVIRSIHTNGRFAGGSGDFAAMAGDFAARKPLKRTGRFVVADIYALDIPFIRVGQKAWVTALSGSGAKFEGRIAGVYPNDETQSRVTRVRIDLTQAPADELFANVDIEAASVPVLSVPSSAVMDTGTDRYVFVRTEPGTFAPRKIVTGFQGTGSWEVLSGLKEGEQVVDGANFLIDADSKLNAAFSDEK